MPSLRASPAAESGSASAVRSDRRVPLQSRRGGLRALDDFDVGRVRLTFVEGYTDKYICQVSCKLSVLKGQAGGRRRSTGSATRLHHRLHPGSCSRSAADTIRHTLPCLSHYDLLAHAHERAMEFLNSLPDRPVAPRASFEELMAALGGPLPEAPQDPVSIVLDLSSPARAGPRRQRRAALLRFCHRRKLSARRGRRLARVDLGPERRAARHVAGDFRSRGLHGALDSRPARAARAVERRVS